MLPFEYISILAFQLIADLVWQLHVHQYISLLLAQPDTLMWDNIDFLYIILSFSKKTGEKYWWNGISMAQCLHTEVSSHLYKEIQCRI